MQAPQRLPRGRHHLSRNEVEVDQRLRIFVAMAEAMADAGYVRTPVAEIIRRAGVSRQTFYGFYEDKHAAFLAGFDLVASVLAERLAVAVAPPPAGAGAPDRLERVEHAVGAYLDALADEPSYARLFLVEVHAAGPEAMARRAEVQQQIAAALAEAVGAVGNEGRFACAVLVAAVGSMVTGPLVSGDIEGLRALGPPVRTHLRRMYEAGLLGPVEDQDGRQVSQ